LARPSAAVCTRYTRYTRGTHAIHTRYTRGIHAVHTPTWRSRWTAGDRPSSGTTRPSPDDTRVHDAAAAPPVQQCSRQRWRHVGHTPLQRYTVQCLAALPVLTQHIACRRWTSLTAAIPARFGRSGCVRSPMLCVRMSPLRAAGAFRRIPVHQQRIGSASAVVCAGQRGHASR
jgi:hypothetical protein